MFHWMSECFAFLVYGWCLNLKEDENWDEKKVQSNWLHFRLPPYNLIRIHTVKFREKQPLKSNDKMSQVLANPKISDSPENNDP